MGTTKQAENGNEMVDDRSDYERTDPSFIDDLRESKDAVAVAPDSCLMNPAILTLRLLTVPSPSSPSAVFAGRNQPHWLWVSNFAGSQANGIWHTKYHAPEIVRYGPIFEHW